MKSLYIFNKKSCFLCIEIAFLSTVNPCDTVQQLSSLCQLCLVFLLLHATCHTGESWAIFKWHCLFNCFLSFCSCWQICNSFMQLIQGKHWKATPCNAPEPPQPHCPLYRDEPTVWHALKYNILTACTISSWNFCFITAETFSQPTGGVARSSREWGRGSVEE